MAYSIRLLFEEIKIIGGVTIVDDDWYPFLNSAAAPAPFEAPIRLMSVKNLTDVTLFLSIDGINPHDVLPAGGALVYDFTSNRVSDDGLFIAENTLMYAMRDGVSPTTGAIYLIAGYGRGD